MLSLAVLGAVVSAVVSGSLINVATAAVWQGPPAATIPPDNNRPFVIWNSEDSGVQQAGASMSIDGMIVVGADTTTLLAAENLIYGNTNALSAGNLLLLQTDSDDRVKIDTMGDIDTAGTLELGDPARVLGAAENLLFGTMDDASQGDLLLFQVDGDDRFRVTKEGEAVFKVGVRSDGCFGPTFVGVTPQTYRPVEVGTYLAAHAICAAAFPAFSGVHVCTVGEILESYQCMEPTHPIANTALNGTNGWVHGGPPGFTAEANDCAGWSSSAASSYGRFWIFNNATGGRATITSCNVPDIIPFACCK
jgi:hypothetical protein